MLALKPKKINSEVSRELLAQLKEHLVCRRIARGMALLAASPDLPAAMDPRRPNAGVFLAYLAQWVDVGYERPSLVREALARFPRQVRAQLCLRDYVHLRMAEGMLAMSHEGTAEAIEHFDFIRSLAGEIDDKELLSIANFWKGRCLRMKGEYDEALSHTMAGRDLALELGHKPMAAVMRVVESWLFFQKGNHKDAIRILQEAEATLRETDDFITLGNIQSSYGRIARRQGRYQHAVEYFAKAIAEYKKRDAQHRNVARSLLNMASAKRMIALHLRRKIDADVLRRRKAAARGGSNGGAAKTQYLQRFDQLRMEALRELQEAELIYRHYPNHHGIGSVHLNYGNLYLDTGDVEHADAEAATAFHLGQQKKDYILMARSRLLQCMIANARVEEEIGEGAEPGSHARAAQDCVNEAIELTKHTQNRRLLAFAYVWQGLTFCNRFFDDIDSARRSYDLATTFSRGDSPDDTWADMQLLKSQVLRTGSVNPTLRGWSQGSVGDKTFQQITREFEELIIPKVWEREGRRVSRVAARLAISPKKVRRILGRIGQRKPAK